MAQRRHHYERAFEEFLRSRRIPYVAVDEARKSLVPQGIGEGGALKSFDFVMYGAGAGGGNLLVDVKGRRVGTGKKKRAGRGGESCGRLESWVTREDVAALTAWERLFGAGFAAAFVFVYACEQQPPDGMFREVFEHGGTWYALRTVTVRAYEREMRVRSERWGTVEVERGAFERMCVGVTG